MGSAHRKFKSSSLHHIIGGDGMSPAEKTFEMLMDELAEHLNESSREINELKDTLRDVKSMLNEKPIPVERIQERLKAVQV